VKDIYALHWALDSDFCHMCFKLHVQDNLVISKAVVRFGLASKVKSHS